MHMNGFTEGQGLASQPSESLTHRVIEPLQMIGLPVSFVSAAMVSGRQDVGMALLAISQTVGTGSIGARDGRLQALTGGIVTPSDDQRDDLSRPSAQHANHSQRLRRHAPTKLHISSSSSTSLVSAAHGGCSIVGALAAFFSATLPVSCARYRRCD